MADVPITQLLQYPRGDTPIIRLKYFPKERLRREYRFACWQLKMECRDLPVDFFILPLRPK
jgi:hypothetical protein